MPYRQTLACGLQKCVGNLWKGNDYSDFIVIVEDSSFKCHCFILSACSGFFQGMFRSPMKEQKEGRAKLDGMTASTFEIIINAVYTGVEELSIDNVLDVWSASEMLQIEYLTEQCHTFVMENISVETCFRFLNHATLYAAQTVINHCLDFISRNVKEVGGEEHLLPLPFDQFYKVIANQYLAIDHEEKVVAAILNWVKYNRPSASSTSMDSGINTEDINDTNDEQSDGDGDACAVVHQQYRNVSKVTKIENRKQHLPQLLSACKLCRVKSNFLDNVMKNNAKLFVDTGAYQLMHEALMYTMDVARRHDAWPDAAVYRVSSEFKHVMVFLSKDKLMAYNLNTGRVVEVAKLPGNYQYNNFTISIFDNILYLLSNIDSYDNKEFYMLEDEKTWKKMNSIDQDGSIVLLPHGNSIYYCCIDEHYDNNYSLYCFNYAHGHVLKWTNCGQLEDLGNCLVRFHKYVLVFCTKDDLITVECYNTETAKTHKCTTSMSGTSMDMVSFTHSEDVYILQRNGCLWKIFSTDILSFIPVDFELVCKFWDFDCSLKGCVLYRKALLIFCNSKHPKPTLTSLPGVFTRIAIINIGSIKSCLPMTLKLS